MTAQARHSIAHDLADHEEAGASAVASRSDVAARPSRQASQALPAAAAPAEEADLSQDAADAIDRSARFAISRLTFGLSPAALSEAYFDWLIHVLSSPGKQSQLWQKGARKWLRWAHYCAMATRECECCIQPLPQDRRFDAEAWKGWPFNLISQAFLLQQQWWHNATVGVRGVTRQHQQQVEFAARQLLDMISPSNFILTNPEVIEKTRSDYGLNLVRGFWNFIEDWERAANGKPPVGLEAFKVGENLATTDGEVIYRNDLIELIQYTPRASRVRREPVLIVPAWIMKYYILDLSRQNSLVRYLLDEGFTVFIISWKNPTSHDRELGLDDYRRLGVEASMDMIGRVLPERKVHGVGYCLGGTLLAASAAAWAREQRNNLATLTLLAAQVDFKEAGELTLFINEAQVTFLEDMMWQQGYLDARQMSGAFQLLRSNDLVWSRMVRDYLLGERRPLFDLMAWNADSTRMPYRMHSEYLRQLFLHNDLAEGRYRVDGRPVALTDITVPVFAVATETDHVAPWRSVYKLHLLLDTDLTFLLTTGGHNAGIVSPPSGSPRSYKVHTTVDHDVYQDPDTWQKQMPARTGSWWPEWVTWLSERSTGLENAIVPGGGKLVPLCKAPGTYVLQN
jgi:polyhydroxyalkanoate synthase